MKKNRVPVRFTGQHFTVNRKLIADAIRFADIGRDDLVLDIGAGKGAITAPLSRKCRQVIAIERDRALVRVLDRRFPEKSNVTVAGCDFRSFRIPPEPFKVVSSIPYGITSEIFKSLMFDHATRFRGGTLITQLEPARKLLADEVHNPYIILYRTIFELKLRYEVAPDHFMPPPGVMSALLDIRRRPSPLLEPGLEIRYLMFLRFLLDRPELAVRTALKKVFRKKQVRDLTGKLGVDPDGKITRLSAEHWACSFRELMDKVPDRYHPE
jgi:23S rRNA (adenine-N6)-dimethyltransferase